MKTISYRLFVITLVMYIVYGCYDDKGNYDYVNVNEITIDVGNTPASQVIAAGDVISIDAKVNQTKGHELTYDWEIISRSPEFDYDANRFLPVDTVSRTTSFNEQFPAEGDYIICFNINDMNTGLRTQFRFGVSVKNSYQFGLMVLHDDPEGADIDLIQDLKINPVTTNDRVHIRNIYSKMNQKKIAGEGVAISHPIMVIPQVIPAKAFQEVFVLTTRDGGFLRRTDFFEIMDMSKMMYAPIPDMHVEAFDARQLAQHYGLVVNKKLIVGSRVYEKEEDASLCKFSTIIQGDYEAAPFVRIFPTTNSAVIFDQKNHKFQYTKQNFIRLFNYPEAYKDKNNPDNNAKFDLNAINKKLKYMGIGFERSFQSDYLIFEDYAPDDKIWLYITNLTQTSGNNKNGLIYDLSECENIRSAEKFTFGVKGEVQYYNVGNTVYNFTLPVGGGTVATSRKMETRIPATEQITMMKVFTSQLSQVAQKPVTDGHALMIGTYDEGKGEGKLYIYGINPINGQIDLNDVSVYDGLGRVRDVNQEMY